MTHIYRFFFIFFPTIAYYCRYEYGSLCCKVGPSCLSIIYIIYNSMYIYDSLHLLNPKFRFTQPVPPGNPKSALYICEAVSISETGSSVSYFRFHIYVISYGICFFLTSLSMIMSSCIHVEQNVFKEPIRENFLD